MRVELLRVNTCLSAGAYRRYTVGNRLLYERLNSSCLSPLCTPWVVVNSSRSPSFSASLLWRKTVASA